MFLEKVNTWVLWEIDRALYQPDAKPLAFGFKWGRLIKLLSMSYYYESKSDKASLSLNITVKQSIIYFL